jgi:hypothetical protein
VIVDQDAHPPHHLPQTDHGTALEQLVTTDKHSYHHALHLHTPLLTAAAMVIRLSPKASRPFRAAWFRAATYRERPGAGWRGLWSH